MIIGGIGGNGSFKFNVDGNADFYFQEIQQKWLLAKDKSTETKIRVINEIINFSIFIDNEKLLKQVLIDFWSAPVDKIMNTYSNAFHLHDMLKVAKKNLFWKWKELIEVLVLIGLKKKYNKDIKSLIKSWDSRNTSSVILHNVFNQENREYFKDIDFEYKGFCPYDLDNRLIALFSFPIDNFISLIDEKIPNLNTIKDSLSSFNEVKFDIHIEIPKVDKSYSLDKLFETWLDIAKKIFGDIKTMESCILKKVQSLNELCSFLDELKYSIFETLKIEPDILKI